MYRNFKIIRPNISIKTVINIIYSRDFSDILMINDFEDATLFRDRENDTAITRINWSPESVKVQNDNQIHFRNRIKMNEAKNKILILSNSRAKYL